MAKYISRAAKKPKKSKVIIFLNIVIGLLTAVLLITLVSFLSDINDTYYNRKFGDSLTSRYIERGDYADLVNEYLYDYGTIGMVNDGYEDAAAVAEYADAAFRYNAYEKAGDTVRAAGQKARMDDAAEKVGIYEPELSRIDDILTR